MSARLVLLALLFTTTACQDRSTPPSSPPPRVVRTAVVAPAGGAELTLSGIVHARFETPLSFQVGGRIHARHVDTGKRVKAGQLLFELDPRDLLEAVRAAEAERAAAQTGAEAARRELARMESLAARQFVSAAAVERAQSTAAETAGRLAALEARLTQARNALAYGRLAAPADGVIITITGEPGQVVNPGQTVAVLAQGEAREVEVDFPEHVPPPEEGVLKETGARLRLREVAGAADPVTRTFRARYRIEDAPAPLPLGGVVRAVFHRGGSSTALRVPLAALDERGSGPRVWRIIDGRAQPVAVEVLSVDLENATVRGPLRAGERVIALGTHLLHPGMPVREAAP